MTIASLLLLVLMVRVANSCMVGDSEQEITCYDNVIKVTSDPRLVQRVTFHGSILDWGGIQKQFPALTEWRCVRPSVVCTGLDKPTDMADCNCVSTETTTIGDSEDDRETWLIQPTTSTFDTAMPTSTFATVPSSVPTETLVKAGIIPDKDWGSISSTSHDEICTGSVTEAYESVSWKCVLSWFGGVKIVVSVSVVGICQISLSLYGLGTLLRVASCWFFKVRDCLFITFIT